MKIGLTSEVANGSKLLRQAGAAEGEPRSQISCGRIQTRIGFEDLENGFGVHVYPLAQGADFVGKSDLQSMENIAYGFDGLGCSDRGLEHFSRNPVIDLTRRAERRRIGGTDHGDGRFEEV